MTTSQEVLRNAAGTHEPAHLAEVKGTYLFGSSFLQKSPFLAQLLAWLLTGCCSAQTPGSSQGRN